MPYIIEAKPDVPCIYGDFSGLVTSKELNTSANDVIQLRQEQFSHLKQIYYISDFQGTDSNFGHALKSINKMPAIFRQLETNSIETIVIAPITNPWLRLSRDFLRRVNIGIVSFATFEEAVEYVQLQIKS